MLYDQTLDVLRRGYVFTAWARLHHRPRNAAKPTRYAATVRLLGRPASVIGGPDGVRLFYDGALMRRRHAMPAAVARPLFGRGAVHGLDGEVHRHRKAMFVQLLMDPVRVRQLLELADELLLAALESWRAVGGGTVYTTATEVYGRAVIRWAGIDVAPADEARRARDLAGIVDGFATPVRPYLAAWRARRACDRWAVRVIDEVRGGSRRASEDSVLVRVATHRDADGELLDRHTAAVELLNVLRPSVAVARFAAFGALALAEHPEWRERLAREVEEQGTAVGGQLATAFAHEVRRVYPFVPMLTAVTTRATSFEGCPIPAGRRVLLDVMATNHDPREWPEPNRFQPERFAGTGAEWNDHFVPQGGGSPETGHRCPGEMVSVGLLALTCARLAETDADIERGQDTRWSWRRVPAAPRSGVRLAMGRPPTRAGGGGAPAGSGSERRGSGPGRRTGAGRL